MSFVQLLCTPNSQTLTFNAVKQHKLCRSLGLPPTTTTTTATTHDVQAVLHCVVHGHLNLTPNPAKVTLPAIKKTQHTTVMEEANHGRLKHGC